MKFNDETGKVLDAIKAIEQMLEVWVIVERGDLLRGRVIAKTSKSGTTTIVTFQMFYKGGIDHNIYGYRRKTGSLIGYRVNEAMAEMLKENAEELETYFGLDRHLLKNGRLERGEDVMIFGTKYDVVQAL